MNKLEEILKCLYKSLGSLGETNLFGTEVVNYTEIDMLCKDYLQYRDFKVIALPKREVIKKAEDLVNYFYSLYRFHKGSACPLVANRKKDIILISKFVKQRREYLDCSLEEAMQDTATIIEALFIYKEDLGLNREAGIWIFGTDKCKWITDKIISLLNTNYVKYNETVMLNKAQIFSKANVDVCTGFDIDEINKRRGLNG